MQITFEYTTGVDLAGLIDWCDINNITYRINIDKDGWYWNNNIITIWYNTVNIVETLAQFGINKCIIED